MLANRPDIVLADEPTGQLDPDTAGGVLNLEADLGIPLVVVSYDRQLAGGFESVVGIEDGTIVQDSDSNN